jgi:hypothetical protein
MMQILLGEVVTFTKKKRKNVLNQSYNAIYRVLDVLRSPKEYFYSRSDLRSSKNMRFIEKIERVKFREKQCSSGCVITSPADKNSVLLYYV